MKYFILAISLAITSIGSTFAQNTKSFYSIPDEVSARTRHYLSVQASNEPYSDQEACQVLMDIRDLAYPKNSSTLSYPSVAQGVTPEVASAYAASVGKANSAIATIDRELENHYCVAPANDKCCKRGTTRDKCKTSTGNKCEVDSYGWCTSSSNSCP